MNSAASRRRSSRARPRETAAQRPRPQSCAPKNQHLPNQALRMPSPMRTEPWWPGGDQARKEPLEEAAVTPRDEVELVEAAPAKAKPSKVAAAEPELRWVKGAEPAAPRKGKARAKTEIAADETITNSTPKVALEARFAAAG